MVDQTLKYTNQIQLERRRLLEQKEELERELIQLKKSRGDDQTVKAKFYEGAAWSAKQSYDVAVQTAEKAEQMEMEFKNKMKDNDQFLQKRAIEWMVASVNRILEDNKQDQ